MEFFNALRESFYEQVGDAVYLGEGTVITLNIIVWSLFMGFMAAIAITLYNKLVPGAFVRALIKKEARNEDSAITAKEAGHTNIFVKAALRKGSSLRRIVHMVGDTDTSLADTPFSKASFYIPEDSLHRAEVTFGKEGMSPLSVILAVIAFFALAVVAFTAVPDLIQLLDNFLAGLNRK